MTNNQIVVRLANEAELSLWDNYVDTHVQGTPYHRIAWLQAITHSYQFPYQAIVAVCEQSKAIKGVFGFCELAIPFKGKTLCALPYCDVGGPLADDEDICDKLLAFAQQALDRTQATSLQVRASFSDVDENLDLHGQKVRMLLSLPPDSERLMASFKSKLRSQIRKAEKNGLTYKIGNSPELINDFYHVYCINMRDLGSPAHHRNWFNSIAKYYQSQLLVSVVYHENQAIGGGIVLMNKTIAAIPWASTIQAFNRLAPNMLLYWSVLSACADKQIEQFDFGRSTFNEGTFKFKKQWGAQAVKLNWQRYDATGLLPELQHDQNSSPLREQVENVWRKMPLPLTVYVGGKIRKYISL